MAEDKGVVPVLETAKEQWGKEWVQTPEMGTGKVYTPEVRVDMGEDCSFACVAPDHLRGFPTAWR